MNESVIENAISKQLNNIVASQSPEQQVATLSTLRRIFDNIIQHPNDDKYHQIKLTSKTFSSKVWQYPAGEELMKMSGWVVEDDYVRLRDDSCVQIVSRLLKVLSDNEHTKRTLLSSTATNIVPIPPHVLQVLVEMMLNGHVFLFQMLLSNINISISGRVYSESGSSVNLLIVATIGQNLDIIKILLHDFSVDPYVTGVDDERPYIFSMFSFASQPFTIDVLKCCGVKSDFKEDGHGLTLLHGAVFANCFDVVKFLVKECKGVDINITDDDLQTPLHIAYLAGCTQIAQYLIQHGANVFAVDKNGYTPYDYIDGEPKLISLSKHLQSKRKIHHIPYSTEYFYYMKLVKNGIGDKEAVSLTKKQFSSLEEDKPTQLHHDVEPQDEISRAAAIKEFAQYATKGLVDDNSWKSTLFQEQRQQILFT